MRILVNRKSGFLWSFKDIQEAFDHYWDTPENDLSYQFCKDKKDGWQKSKQAAEQGFDVLLIVGGDGTVSTAGSALIGTKTALGVVPMGSGNGFARHFGIPLKPEDAAKALATADTKRIDVGMVNEKPFLVTCSMAWDAAIVKSFDRSPVRGVIPYIFAGVYEFLGYNPQEITAELDTGEVLSFSDTVIFTIANLTQYGGGAVISADAHPDDEMLELVVAQKQDMPVLVANIHRLLNESISKLPRVVFRRFRSLTVTRTEPTQIQIDGELVDAPQKLQVSIKPSCLSVLVPR